MGLNLYMIRHGQTPASRENRFSGRIDPPLTEEGRQMAEHFARAYAGVKWTAIYSSPMVRTLETAEPLCRRAGLRPIVDDGLKEIHYGEWDGMLQDEVRQRWPEAWAYWAADVASRGAPGGETAFSVAARAMNVVEHIRNSHRDGNVLVVSHKATLRVVICALLGMDVRMYRDRIAQPVAGVSLFEMKPTGPLMKRMGDVSHLPVELQNAEGT